MSKKKKFPKSTLRFVAVYTDVRKVFIPIKGKTDDMEAKAKGFIRIFVDISILKHGVVPGLDDILWHMHESATMHKYNGGFRFMVKSFGKYNPNQSLTEDEYVEQFKDPETLAGILVAIDEAKLLYVPKKKKEDDSDDEEMLEENEDWKGVVKSAKKGKKK